MWHRRRFSQKNKNRSRTVHWLSRDVFVVFLDMDLAYGASARVRSSGPPGSTGCGEVSLRHPMGYPAWWTNIAMENGHRNSGFSMIFPLKIAIYRFDVSDLLYRTLWWTNIWLWKDPPFFMGKSTISMAIFHCYVSSPEGTRPGKHPTKLMGKIHHVSWENWLFRLGHVR